MAQGALAVVLAAGQGKRMRSLRAKVLHPVGGVPMVLRVLAAARTAGLDSAVVVVGYAGDEVAGAVAAASVGPVSVVWQRSQRGTGDAVACALAGIAGGLPDDVVVLPGDAPLLPAQEISGLLADHRASGAAATLLTAHMDDPHGYGRILRDRQGRVAAIVEDRDATPAQRAIREINTLVACYRTAELRAALDRCQPLNAQGEIYLTDVVGLLVAAGRVVEARCVPDPLAVLGVNDRQALAQAESALRQRTLVRLMAQGVTVADPASTWVDEAVEVSPDCTLLPGTRLEGECRLGSGCTVGPNAHLRDCRLEAGVAVADVRLRGVAVRAGCHLGPGADLAVG